MATRRTRKPRKPAAAPARPINLALQGGGAHGAFTWGVLDRLLVDGRGAIDGICGTSAGAMNAVLVAHGLMHGGHDGARATLADFWQRVSRMGALLNPAALLPGADPVGNSGSQPGAAVQQWALESFTRMFSPYQFNPLNLNPLRDLLAQCVDFEALHHCGEVKLFLCATNVRSGKVRIFDNAHMSVDAVMASACLPHLFQAVEIDGEHYWDGGYMGNPVLFPLFYHTDTRDVVVVMVNQIRRENLPTTPAEIADRVNEISFNSSLMREMRAVEFVTSLIDGGAVKGKALKRMRLHAISAHEQMTGFSVASKLNADWEFLIQLRDIGRATAEAWLTANHARLGVDSTIDIKAEYL